MVKNIITPQINKKGKVIRNIRSFVCRQRKLTLFQKNALQILWPKIGVDFIEHPLLFDSLFINRGPVVLEIGFGMGESLISMAKKNLDKNFLGIEVYLSGIIACLVSASDAKLDNLRIIFHDAIEVLKSMLPDGSLSVVQLFFPDPWPKLRHNKRRIIQKSFADLVLHKLEMGGILHIVTDFQDYAEYILSVIRKISNYQNLSVSGDYLERPIFRPVTRFEKRAKRLGCTLFELMFEKQDDL